MLNPVLREAEVVLGDVSVPSQIERAVAGIDVVIHLAGHSGAASSVQDPVYDLAINVGGLITLLEAVRKQDRPARVVFPGSRLEYGRAKALPVRETDPMHPLAPYGVNKYACELYLDLYSRLYGISYGVARLTNPYGPSLGDPHNDYNVMNRLIATAAKGGCITVYGDGKQLRDYVYVDDAMDALAVLCAAEENLIVNVGSGRGISFLAAAQTIVSSAGRGTLAFAPWPAEAARVETGDFVADIALMKALGWEPRTSFEHGVLATLAHAEHRK